MTTKIKALIGAGIIAVFVIFIIALGISASNREISLRNEFSAKEKARSTTLDGMWKKIQQKHQISGEYEKTFKGVIESAVQGRQGGELFKFTKESYPQLSTDLYKDLMATIEAGQYIQHLLLRM